MIKLYLIFFMIIILINLLILINLIKNTKYKRKNYDIRPDDIKIDTIEILITGHKNITGKNMINIFKKFGYNSTNYIIDHDGNIITIVPEKFRAWSSGMQIIDNRSITIMLCITISLYDEIKCCISDETEKSLKLLCRDIMNRYDIRDLKFNDNLGNFRFFMPSMKSILPLFKYDSIDEDNINTIFSNYPKDYYICSNMERIAQEINFS